MSRMEENILLSSQKFKEARGYWEKKLGKGICVTSLENFGQGKVKSSKDESGINMYRYIFSDKVVENINLRSKNSPYSAYILLLAGINIVLNRYTGKEDIVLGSPVFKLRQVSGLLNNILLIRSSLDGDVKISDLLNQVKTTVAEADKYHQIPMLNLIDGLNNSESCNKSKIETIVLLDNIHDRESIKDIESDLVIMFSLKDSQLQMTIDYNSRAIEKEYIMRFAVHIEKALGGIFKDFNSNVSQIEILSEQEKSELMDKFNSTKVADTPKCSLHELFEEQVRKTPDNIAIVYEEERITYSELNKRANVMARFLNDRGIGENTLVGIMVDRSVEMMVGILAILKSGAAYIPIDPNYPEDRINYLIENSAAQLLLTPGELKSIGKLPQDKIVKIKDVLTNKKHIDKNLNLKLNRDRLMYVLYTSGSTGNPKGVMVKNDSFVNLMHWFTEEFDINEKENILLIASASFDLAQKNLYASLIKGGRLILLTSGMINYNRIIELIKEESITSINCTPSAFYPIIESPKNDDFKNIRSLTKVFLGGEEINTKRLVKWIKSAECKGEIINTYGPTECTDIATFYRIDNKYIEDISSVPIGKPINNVRLYILDKQRRLSPIGVNGELYIGGAGVSRGYYNDLNKTNDYFVEVPHIPEELVYKTGDVVRWLPDGNIQFRGRADYQVKIRGFRIELGEIESQLLRHENIKEAAVIAREDDDKNKYIVAYFISDKNLSMVELKKFLGITLPDYMIPQYLIKLKEFPLTPNGKVDRKSLPTVNGNIETGTTYKAPENRIEAELAEIWTEILNVDKIGVNDGFFELGGHSFKAINMISRIQRSFGVELTMNDIFDKQTIKNLAGHILTLDKKEDEIINPSVDMEYYPMTPAQKRIYALQQINQESTVYNMPTVLVVEGEIENINVEESMKKLINRHESLRTSFHMINGETRQKIAENISINIDRVKVQENNIEKEIDEFIRPFKLENSPLMRVRIGELSEDKILLMLDIHHIISDGVSISVLQEEFMRICRGEVLSDVKLQYKDYAVWLDNIIKEKKIEEQKEYWLDRFKGETPVLNMPTDHKRPKLKNYCGSKFSYEIDPQTTEEIKKLAVECETTLNMVMLSVYYILLSKYSGQEDIVIGNVSAGRKFGQIEKTVGMFVNTLAIRNSPNGDKEYLEFLQEVKQSILEGHENQELPFEDLVDSLQLKRDVSRNPLFDTLFIMENIDFVDIEVENVRIRPYVFENSIAKFDLTLTVSEVNEKLNLNMEYSTELFEEATIKNILEDYDSLIQSLIKCRSSKISELTLYNLTDMQIISETMKEIDDFENDEFAF